VAWHERHLRKAASTPDEQDGRGEHLRLRGVDWEEGHVIRRKAPRWGMKRATRDGGAARHAAARQRGRRGEAAYQRIGNFYLFLEKVAG
jgi:hypothetical protein